MKRSRKLRRRCARPTALGTQALANILKGFHPNNSAKSRGIDGQRKREVKAEATFDGETRKWVRDNRRKGWRANAGMDIKDEDCPEVPKRWRRTKGAMR